MLGEKNGKRIGLKLNIVATGAEIIQKMKEPKSNTLRLILADQLNINHTWFNTVDETVTYLMMEIRTETDYAKHHIQKVLGVFAAMQNFAQELKNKKHNVIYIKINDKNNLQSFDKNCYSLIIKNKFNQFEI